MSERWALAAFFNPAQYSNKVENFRQFSDGVRAQGVKLLAVECCLHPSATPGQEWELTSADCDWLVRVYSGSVLWQKEALLNIGRMALPPEVDRFAWLDADVIFENPDWAKDAWHLLDFFRLLQCFREVDGDPGMVVAQSYARDPRMLDGHPGYAWAARREGLPGFYDRCIVGGADNILAWAAFGHAGFWPGYGREGAYFSAAQLAHIQRWSAEFHQAIDRRIGCVEGSLRHLEHGSAVNRRYMERLLILKRHEFDPIGDVYLNSRGALEWLPNTGKRALWREVEQYFRDRREEAA
jgi:hypothetical protein